MPGTRAHRIDDLLVERVERSTEIRRALRVDQERFGVPDE